jgi:hypothetical protein
MAEWWNSVDHCTLGGMTLLVIIFGLLVYVETLWNRLGSADRACEARGRLLIGAREDATRASQRYDQLTRWYLAACCEMKAKDPKWCPPDRRGL